MAVDYNFPVRNRFEILYTLTSQGNEHQDFFIPYAGDATRDQYCHLDRFGDDIRLMQRGTSGYFDGTLLEIITTNPDVGYGCFVEGPTVADDQICCPDNGTNLQLWDRDASGLFSTTSANTTLTTTNNWFSGNPVFIKNRDDRDKDQILMGNSSNVTIFQRNAATSKFDAGSTVLEFSTGQSLNNQHRGVAYGPTPDTDQVFLGRTWMQRNTTTGLMDSGSSYSSTGRTSFSEFAVFLPHLTNSDHDQMAIVSSGNVAFWSRNSTTKLFEFDFLLPVIGAGPSSLEFIPSRINSGGDYIMVTCLGTPDSWEYIQRNGNLFDSGSNQVNYENDPETNSTSLFIYAPHSGNNQLDSVICGGSTIRTFNARRFAVSTQAVETLEPYGIEDFTGEVFQLAPPNELIISSSQITGFEFDRYAAFWGGQGLGTVTRISNTETTIADALLRLEADAEIDSDHRINLVNSTLNLVASTRNTSVEDISLDANGTVVVDSTWNLESFTFANGTTIDNAGATAIDVTISSDPGIVTTSSGGGAVNILAPVVSYLRQISGFPVGSAAGIFLRSAPGIADTSQFTLAAGNNSGNGSLVINESIPNDTPSSGFVRVATDSGGESRVEYSSWAGSTFTLTGTLPSTYSSGNGTYVGYLDVLGSAGTSTSNNLQHVANRDCVLVVRLSSGVSKFTEIRLDVTLSGQDFTQVVSPVTDLINIS